jgi:N-acetylglutamate synthase-like GNAT family acetyltransferase
VIDLGLFAHVETLAVLPAHGRQGLGAELLETACVWALTRGFSAVTLCGFRDVPWSAPFLAGHGFETIPETELPRELLRVRERERAEGWRTELRLIMQREL